MDGFRLELVRRLTIEIVDSTDKVLMVMMNGMISKASGIETLNKHLKQLWQFSLLSKTKWTLESSAVSWPVSVSSCIITLYSLLTTYFVWMHPYIIVLLTHARSSSALVSDKRASQAPPQVSPSTPISRKCISHGPKCSLSHLTFGNKSLVWWQYVQSSYFDLLTLVFFFAGKSFSLSRNTWARSQCFPLISVTVMVWRVLFVLTHFDNGRDFPSASVSICQLPFPAFTHLGFYFFFTILYTYFGWRNHVK